MQTQVIGFTREYYTLWNKNVVRGVEKFNYVQNLSKDYDTAIQKVSGQFEIDLSIMGESSFTKGHTIEEKKTSSCFLFGKYEGKSILLCDDIKYLLWYQDETKNVFSKNVILAHKDYTEFEGRIVHIDYLKEKQEKEDKVNYLESLETGHFFEHGEKVELEIEEVDEFYFEGHYGTTYVITYECKGRKYKYMGGSPKQIGEGKAKIKATIKHNEYNGVRETLLQRIKIIK